jgi:hypothetical protein
MNTRTVVSLAMMLFATAGIANNASAQEKTRAQVREELIEAQKNGLDQVTDTTYPLVNPTSEQEAARLGQKSDSGMGAAMTGASAAGKSAGGRAPAKRATCTGPVSYCDIFFGS